MFCVCVGRAGLPSVMLVYGGRLLCLCTVGIRARCSGSDTRDTGVDYLNLYHLDWSTPARLIKYMRYNRLTTKLTGLWVLNLRGTAQRTTTRLWSTSSGSMM